MAYYHWQEQIKFNKKWEKQKDLFRSAGMSEEAIEKMYAFDLEVYRNNRRFYEHTCTIAEFSDETEGGEEKSPLMGQYMDKMAIKLEISYKSEGRYGWIDEMDSEWLVNGLKSLSAEDKDLIRLLMEQEQSKTDLAKSLGKSSSWVSWKINQIREKLMKFKAGGAD